MKVHTRVYVDIHIVIHPHLHIQKNTCVCTYIYTCANTYTCMYIHTHRIKIIVGLDRLGASVYLISEVRARFLFDASV